MDKKIIIGIDPGTHTGVAIYNVNTRDLQLQTIIEIWRALQTVDVISKVYKAALLVKIENPNMWKHFSKTKNAAARAQGAGSIKRDFSIWKQFLIERDIPFMELRPDKKRNQIAKNEKIFQQITGFTGRSSEHARVAAMLFFSDMETGSPKTRVNGHVKKQVKETP